MSTQRLISGWPWLVCDDRLYWGMQAMRRADFSTFEAIGEYWGRDAARVYSCGSVMRKIATVFTTRRSAAKRAF